MYGEGAQSESIGEWFQERDHEDYVIASKSYWPTREDDPNGRGLGRNHLRYSIDAIAQAKEGAVTQESSAPARRRETPPA